jgi:hypothetical protein
MTATVASPDQLEVALLQALAAQSCRSSMA